MAFLDRTTPPHIVTLILVTGLAALSLNVFLPSLPAIAAHFGVPYATAQLTVSGYLAMTAVIQIVIGPLSDRFGRRPVLLGAIGIFVLATLGALWAPTFEVFFACRMVQAAVASGFAISRAVVRDMVPMDQAAAMIGWVTMGMSVVPMIGPVIGGGLEQVFGWQASFWMLAAGGVAVLGLVWRDLGETATATSASFGAQVRAYPRLFRSQRFWGYVLAAASASAAFFAFLGGAPYVGTNVYGLSPAGLGAYFAAPAIGYLVGNGLSGRFSARVGVNRMMMAGALVATAGLAVLFALELAGLAPAWVFFGFQIFVGLGNGILLPSANAGMLSVRPELAGSAAGLGGAITIGGGAAVSQLGGWLLEGEGTAIPLVALMLGTSALSILAAMWVIARARAIGA
jgi:DHA1 family bicyclomycin/chloramphenicol resistance-like MFS transporter